MSKGGKKSLSDISEVSSRHEVDTHNAIPANNLNPFDVHENEEIPRKDTKALNLDGASKGTAPTEEEASHKDTKALNLDSASKGILSNYSD